VPTVAAPVIVMLYVDRCLPIRLAPQNSAYQADLNIPVCGHSSMTESSEGGAAQRLYRRREGKDEAYLRGTFGVGQIILALQLSRGSRSSMPTQACGARGTHSWLKELLLAFSPLPSLPPEAV
jgi:hypothetical protein